MGFEVFTRSSAPAPHVPAITIQRRGLFSLNQAAFDMLGTPDAVEFLWDAENQLIGLRPTHPSDLNGYTTRHQGPNHTGPVLIAGTLFTRHIGLDTTTARRWTPTLTDDGILVIDLTAPGAPVTSNRHRSRLEEASQDETLAVAEDQAQARE